MIAIVLSGGGNRGAIEAGALQALFEHGIRPDILVGSSAGAMNAAFIATDPTPAGANRLADLWLNVQRQDIFRGNALTMALRLLLGRDSIFSRAALRRLVESHLPSGVSTFGDLPDKVKLYITAASLNTGLLYLYGEKPEASLLEAVLASSAHPVIFEPLEASGQQLVDGGVVSNVPIEIAIDKGAQEIYVINVGYGGEPRPKVTDIPGIISRTISAMMHQHLLDDLEAAEQAPGVTPHHIHIPAFQNTLMWDLSHSAEMIAEGYRVTTEYLENPQPARETLQQISIAAQAVPPPEGASVYLPRRRRMPR